MFTEADRRLAEYAAAHHGVFSYRHALNAGLSEQQARKRREQSWVRLHEGVYRIPGAAATWKGDLLAACVAAGSPVSVSHRAGAALYGLPGGREGVCEITCRRWDRTKTPGLIVHESTRFDAFDLAEIEGIPVSTPERVILELAGQRPFPDFIEMMIHAARRKRLITYDSTMATFQRLARRGLPGVRAMRVALERWNPTGRPSESEMETLLLQTLRAHGLPEPTLQFEVVDDRGGFIARVDAALPDLRITIDYDSKQEHSDEFQLARDARRRNEIVAAGFIHLAARHGDLCQGGDVIAEQIKRIARRSAS
jgi:hypothetical protein